MFLQFIEGRTSDGEGLRRQMARWEDEQRPEAAGYLGSTIGINDDGVVVVAVRFGTEEAAQSNSARPAQAAWWNETQKFFDGEVRFVDCPEVHTFLSGGSDNAGFVQVIVSRTADPQRVAELAAAPPPSLTSMRPDLIGGTVGLGGDGTVVEIMYFTDEASARQGERAVPPDDARAWFDEWSSLTTDVRYVDVRAPILNSA